MKINLQVEINLDCENESKFMENFIVAPLVNEEYWMFRVQLIKDQAILAFPKFTTIGIGFAIEEDWNCNLPYTCKAREIFDHIKHNKKYEEIKDEYCINAILLIQEAIKQTIKRKK